MSPAPKGASSRRSGETTGRSPPSLAEPVRLSAVKPAETMIAAATPNHSDRTLDRDAPLVPCAVIFVLQPPCALIRPHSPSKRRAPFDALWDHLLPHSPSRDGRSCERPMREKGSAPSPACGRGPG